MAASLALPPIRKDREPPLWRLYTLRLGYLIIAVGLGIEIWPGIILRHDGWGLMQGVVQCMLGALSLLALLGLRYPLKMLPLLLFEIVWKVIWLSVVAAPLLRTGRMDADTASTAFACALVVIFPIVIPWPYVLATFAKAQGDRWR
jgi:hypothetical protein